MLTGTLRKMQSQLQESVHYTLPLGEQQIDINALIGQDIALHFTGSIHCIRCARKTTKSFQQGYCYPCYRELGDCDYCIIHPLRCHAQHSLCDSNNWVHANCHSPHIVYLANTSGLKVGITRATQMPTRWIDQGAVQALPIFKVANRYHSGVIEQVLSHYVADKTNWRVMLKGDPEPLDLAAQKKRLLNLAQDKLAQLQHQFTFESLPDDAIVTIQYPVSQYLNKLASFNLDKNPSVRGTLLGVKGQYLLLDSGVINIRKFGGYEVQLA